MFQTNKQTKLCYKPLILILLIIQYMTACQVEETGSQVRTSRCPHGSCSRESATSVSLGSNNYTTYFCSQTHAVAPPSGSDQEAPTAPLTHEMDVRSQICPRQKNARQSQHSGREANSGSPNRRPSGRRGRGRGHNKRGNSHRGNADKKTAALPPK